jgi:class 3 adenylate cyclase
MTEAEHLPALSSVILLRLIDYARRPVAEQARLNAQLDTVLAVLLPDIPARTRIVLAGNGSAAVAVLDNAPAALAFAERALNANHAGLGLCIGIDHGPVEVLSGEAGDVLAGDGVATASVMAAFATDAGLLVSQNFRTALAQMSPGSEGALVPTVNFSDAGLRTYQVFCLDRLALGRRRRRLMLIAVTSVLLLLITATALRLGVPDRPRPLAPYIGSAVSTTLDRMTRFTHGHP